MMKHILVLSSILIGSLSISAYAGKSLKFQIENGGYQLEQEARVADGKVYFSGLNGNPDRDALFDNTRQTLYIIQHNTKTYYKIDDAVIEQVSGTVDALSQMAAQNGLGDLLAQAGLGGENKFETRAVDKTLTVSGIECNVMQTIVNNEPQSELCIASKAALSELGNEYDTLNGLFGFSEKLIKKAGKILSGLGLNAATFSRAGSEGLPIAGYSFVDQSQSKLLAINDADFVPTDLALPVNYEQARIPFLSQ